MSSYRIFETEQFERDLERLDRAGERKVVEKLRAIVYPQLRQQPRLGPNIKKLKGYTPETWRYRIGPWRFFFEIDEADGVVAMIAAHHRGSAYGGPADRNTARGIVETSSPTRRAGASKTNTS